MARQSPRAGGERRYHTTCDGTRLAARRRGARRASGGGRGGAGGRGEARRRRGGGCVGTARLVDGCRSRGASDRAQRPSPGAAGWRRPASRGGWPARGNREAGGDGCAAARRDAERLRTSERFDRPVKAPGELLELVEGATDVVDASVG
ncbi:MAG TPA: hypothetical protein ENK57_17015 [Polyangiaceae bacterium]|nr:hypothetical protein [Polyangiaceae bacterium]